MFDYQKDYVELLSKSNRQFVNLPLGIGVVEIIREVARTRGRKLIVIAPAILVTARQWGHDVSTLTPASIRKTPHCFENTDLVYIDVGVPSKQTFHSIANSLGEGVDFIWRLS